MRDIAWAAGLYEGEGSCSIKTATTSRAVGGEPSIRQNNAPRMSMGMTDQDILTSFRDIVGTGNVTGPYYYGNGSKAIYQWTTGRILEIQRIGRLFWPYLGQRRRSQMALVFAKYYEGRT